MNTRTFALVWGVIFLLLGASGFIPGLWHAAPEHFPPMKIDSFYGEAILFQVNVLHNLTHLLFGVWGLLASRKLSSAKTFARVTAAAYGVLTIAGFIPGLSTMFGLVPLFGNDIWLHALLGGVAAYFGWMHRDVATGDRS